MSIRRNARRKEDKGYEVLHNQVEIFFSHANGKTIQERISTFYRCNSTWITYAVKKQLTRNNFEQAILKEKEGIQLSGISKEEKKEWMGFYKVLEPQIEVARMQRAEKNKELMIQGVQKQNNLSLYQTMSLNYKKLMEWLKK